MSFKNGVLYPCNPATERGVATKITVHKSKVIYANGRAVILRDLKDPAATKAYFGHTKTATVAQFSPSGYYCASGDAFGTVRVWDTVTEDNILKGEYPVFGGKINDVAWDADSKRIIAVGDGRDKRGAAIMFDSGTSTGEISGHSKAINAVSIRQQRPYRAVTAADDTQIVFHQGPPFKFDKIIKTHTRFVQDVRYSHSGDNFLSVGSDSKIFLYDGKTGDTVAEFKEGLHKGSIMACAWSPDNKLVSTVSLDTTVKLWDVETQKSVQTYTLGPGVPHHQVGNAWTEDGDIISLSLSGALNVFDQRVGDKPGRVLQGPQKSITAGILSSDTNTFFAGTADGRVVSYPVPSSSDASASATDEAVVLGGTPHTTKVTSMAVATEGSISSVGWDDRLREISCADGVYTEGQATLASQPHAVAAAEDQSLFVAQTSKVEVFRSNQKVAEFATSYGAGAVDVYGSTIAVGGDDKSVHLYEWNGKSATGSSTVTGSKDKVTSVSFSPDGTLLAIGDSSGKIILYNVSEAKTTDPGWVTHTSRIASLSWTPDGLRFASGSLDTHVYVWDVKKPQSKIAIRNAGLGGVSVVAWLTADEKKGTLISAGADGCARTWEVTF